jgi:hypothetical protein
MKPPNKQKQSLQKSLSHQHHIILAKQEAFHRQRYKKTGPPMVIEIPPSFTSQYLNVPEEIVLHTCKIQTAPFPPCLSNLLSL